MVVLLPGVAGFVGKEVLRELLAQDHSVIGIVHSQKARKELPLSDSLTVIEGDVTDPALGPRLPSFDACIYLPGLLREFPSKGVTFQGVHVDGVKNLLTAAKGKGARRWIQMSALGVGQGIETGYYSTKLKAEEAVKESGLDWTIFRPSVVFSEKYDPRLNFVSELGDVIRKAPVIPYFGDGNYRLQPVSLQVLAKAMVDSLNQPGTICKTYEVGGPDKLTYKQILKTIADAQGIPKPMVSVPFGIVRGAASLLDGFAFFPITRDQLAMLEHENVVNDPKVERDFIETFKPKQVTFAEGVRNFYGSKP